MKIDKYKMSSFLVLVVVLIGIVIAGVQYQQQSKNDRDHAIKSEYVGCLSAICVDRAPGHHCLELSSSIATVIVTEDNNVVGAKRIVIETSDKRCGNPTFK